MAHETIRQLVTAQVAGFSACPVVWENQPRKQDPGPWGRFSILYGESNPGQIGVDKMSRVPGLLILQMFLPENTGVTEAHQAADELANLLNEVHLFQSDTAIRFGHVSIDSGSLNRSGGWIQKNISCSFQADCYP